MKIKSIIVSGMTVAALSGCGSDSNGGSGSGSNKPATEAQAIAAIKTIWTSNGTDIEVDTAQSYPSADPDNISRNELYYCYNGVRCALDPNAPAVEELTARYNASEDEQIPVYFNINPSSGKAEEKDPRFIKAIETINEIVGRPIFKDMGFVNIDHNVTESELSLDYSSIQENGGMIFSVGTSVKVSANQQTCGSVSKGPNTMSTPHVIIDENNHLQADKGWVWLNLDSHDGTCLADVEIAAHELMHALGFNDHFAGFGADNEVFGDRAKAALRTLYNNDAQLDPENVTYYHWPAN